VTIAADRITYEDLYGRWEVSAWSAARLNFAEDARQWREELTDSERRAVYRLIALFLWGEDAVADGLSPYIDAAPREEQKYILAAQQSDEARHAVMFARLSREVLGDGATDVAGTLEAVRSDLTWSYDVVFGRLREIGAELRADPSPAKLAAAVALYHFVIEAGLAQPGQHFLHGFLERRDVLPGLREGIERIMLDEHRHIGGGVKLLADLNREHPESLTAVGELLRDVLPPATALLMGRDKDIAYVESLGFSMEEMAGYGARAIENALAAAGITLEQLAIPTLPPDLTPEERGTRAVELTRVGVIGPPTDDPPRDRQHMAAVFDALRRSVRPDHGLKRPATLLWRFEDADPWHLTIAAGGAVAAEGAPERPTLTFRCRYADWIDVMAGRRDLVRLLAARRLRAKGDLRLLVRLGRVFSA
jgi:hypothetical protein